MPHALRPTILLGFLAFNVPAPAIGQPATVSETRFDGRWFVTEVCQTTSDGASGYTFHFTAEVTNGILHGENGVRNQPGWLSLDGKLQPDGTAVLAAVGLTGGSNFNVGRVMPKTSYNYHVNAHFEGIQGTGTRVELRPCSLTFDKSG
jgi:hypothetical protein